MMAIRPPGALRISTPGGRGTDGRRSAGRAPLGKTRRVPWHPPDPPLQADPVLLRPFRIGDAADVAAACTDPGIVRFTFMQEGLTEVDARAWIERSNE